MPGPSSKRAITFVELARLDRKRPKKGSNDDWTHPQDPDAKITKMKDGRTLRVGAGPRAALLEGQAAANNDVVPWRR